MKRRNRADWESRDYVCPCGKAYLSYAAMHTHIKKYHSDEKDMLKSAKIPRKPLIKRGRPTRKESKESSQELQDLTLFEVAALKIYELIDTNSKEDVMLSGNDQINPQEFQQLYRSLLQRETQSYTESVSQNELTNYEAMIEHTHSGLAKHFTVKVSARIKLMLVVGCLEKEVHGSRDEECLSRMAACGLGVADREIATVIYDVLVRALQRRPVPSSLLGMDDE